MGPAVCVEVAEVGVRGWVGAQVTGRGGRRRRGRRRGRRRDVGADAGEGAVVEAKTLLLTEGWKCIRWLEIRVSGARSYRLWCVTISSFPQPRPLDPENNRFLPW
jgi:hypothetical protein